MRLNEALKEYVKEDRYPCHMPGHKGRSEYSILGEVLKYDITEIDGMDDLHDAHGIIKESEENAAKMYGSGETHFLVNGSSSGILSAILGTVKENESILIGRNCHRSVYNAVEIGRINCIYVYPEYIADLGTGGEIKPDSIKEAFFENPHIKEVVVTCPTYEGVVSDIESIADIVHSYGAMLIVDAAHGAHFGFWPGYPVSAVSQGADIVIHSVHKTLPAPTQTALIHINGPLVNREEVRRQLAIFQSSSPSYLLMAGIDDCMSIIKEKGACLFKEYLENLSDFVYKAGFFKHIRVIDTNTLKNKYEVYDSDPCKLLISADNKVLSGKQIYDILRKEFGIQAEMASETYCLLIMTIMDKKEGFDRIFNALKCIDEKAFGADKTDVPVSCLYDLRPKQILPVYKAAGHKGRKEKLDKASGLISGDYIYLYPPGIPVSVPGEEISELLIERIRVCLSKGLNVRGILEDGMIWVYE